MTQPDLIAAVSPVIDALERLGVAYSIVGSVASSAHGIARASVDAGSPISAPNTSDRWSRR